MNAPSRPRFGRGFPLVQRLLVGRNPLTGRKYRLVPMAILAGALVLAGCGVKGPLEPPPGTQNTASPNPLQTSVVPDRPGETVTSTQTQTATSKAFTSPLGKEEPGKKKRIRQGNVPISSPAKKPDRDFILDDLL
jgi:predicted small lipoprotein YifL